MKRLSPILNTKNLQQSIDFYTQVLGFRVEKQDENWASVWSGEVNIMFTLPFESRPFDQPQFTGSLYLYPENVDEMWLKLKDQCRICYPIENFDYGMREFAVYDNNGYLLQFGNEITR